MGVKIELCSNFTYDLQKARELAFPYDHLLRVSFYANEVCFIQWVYESEHSSLAKISRATARNDYISTYEIEKSWEFCWEMPNYNVISFWN